MVVGGFRCAGCQELCPGAERVSVVVSAFFDEAAEVDVGVDVVTQKRERDADFAVGGCIDESEIEESLASLGPLLVGPGQCSQEGAEHRVSRLRSVAQGLVERSAEGMWSRAREVFRQHAT